MLPSQKLRSEYSMSDVTFEILQNWHIPAIVELEHQLFSGEEWSREQFIAEAALIGDTRMYWVAKSEGRIIGYCGVIVVDDFADVATIAVVPEFRRQGIARRMMAMIQEHAIQRGANRILLEVRTTNESAIALYKSLGYAIIAERPNYYGPNLDAYVMEAGLAA